MTCQTTITPDDVDVDALRRKYAAERDKRLRTDNEAQFVRLDEVSTTYVEDPHNPVVPRDPITEEVDAVVLGAGFSGVLASYHLMRAGVTDIRNIDHAGDFGGVWYWNRYPGIQCDNDAYCYLPLLEETGYIPSKKFADGWEIRAYCRQIAETFGFADKAPFHTHIDEMRWDETSRRWLLRTNRGDDIRARFVVMAAGVQNMPKLPGIPGVDSFKGKMFHTARWDYDYTGGSQRSPVLDRLRDKRVAIIGTGATSIQAVPYLAKYVNRLYVIQRTPSSVDERPNPPTDPDWAKSLRPGWQKERQANFHKAAMEFLAPGEVDQICDIWTEISRNLAQEFAAEGGMPSDMAEFMRRREITDYRVMERLRQRVASIVNDPATAESLKPYYRFSCKRPLSNNDYYAVFNQPNVKLIDVSATKGLERITEHGFVANGEDYEVDLIIFASGFEVTGDLEKRWSLKTIAGRGGRSIFDHWRGGPLTLHGTMTHDFPNQFYIGYIQGGLNATTTEQFGRQGEHIAHIVARALEKGIAAVEPTRESVEDYVRHFEETGIDMSAFQQECTPSYFTNEGQAKAPWALFRGYGPGWTAFLRLLQDWRDRDDFAGMRLERETGQQARNGVAEPA